MIVFPNAKINLGLKIVGKRPDGFHDIETILYPVDLCDILEIVTSTDDITSFGSTGLPIPGDSSDNLCLKAYSLLSSIYTLPPVKIHLHKVIPIGAGLGGGSSDGAFTLILLKQLFQLNITHNEMHNLAGQLGSDCPFFIRNAPVFASGKGDQFEEISLSLKDYRIRIVSPEIQINTAHAYSMADAYPTLVHEDIRDVVKSPPNTWNHRLINDFEKPIFDEFQELDKLKESLYTEGAIYTSMTGSGSSLYAIFKA